MGAKTSIKTFKEGETDLSLTDDPKKNTKMWQIPVYAMDEGSWRAFHERVSCFVYNPAPYFHTGQTLQKVAYQKASRRKSRLWVEKSGWVST